MISTNIIKKSIIVLTVLLLTVAVSYPEVFTFKASKGQKFNIECKIFGKQIINEVQLVKNEQQYKTIRTIKSVDKKGKSVVATINDNSLYYNDNITDSKTVRLSNNDDTTYTRDSLGHIVADDSAIFPTMRNAPIFPEKSIEPGATWYAPSVEVQDFFNDRHKSEFTFNTFYKFIGYEEGDNGKKLAKFEYNYEFDAKNNNDGKIDSRILEVQGKAKTTMFFDSELGSRTEEFYERDYYIAIASADGSATIVHIIDNGIRVWTPLQNIDEEKIIAKLKNKLSKEGLSDTQIVQDDKGIKLVLENIQFEPDSAVLLPKEKRRLDKIARILEEYRSRGLLIVGHTTDRGTQKEREELSLERAKSVTDYLKDKKSYADTKMYYLGKADSEPIADNNTRAGREKNRRVEIFLLDEN